MPGNTGFQKVTVKYFDPVDSEVANRIGIGVRKVGIYSGGYLTPTSISTASLSVLDCEIGDGTDQVRIKTGVDGSGIITVTGLSAANPYVVLKWNYSGDSSQDYMEAAAESSISVLANPNWVIVGKCGSFGGGTFSVSYGFDATDKIVTRTNPNVQDLFLKVEPSEAADAQPLKVRVRGGRVSYGSRNYDIADQLSPLMSSAGPGTKVYAIQITTTGTIAANLLGSYPTDYGGLVTLAEITIVSGAPTITSSMIKDVRGFVGGGANIDTLLPSQTGNSGKFLATNGSTVSWGDNSGLLSFIVNGGGAIISTGVKGEVYIPFACTINSITLLADTSTTTQIDIWKCTYAQFDNVTHPLVGDSIIGIGTIAKINVAQKYQDTVLTGWTGTTIAAGSVLRFNVDSNNNALRLTIALKLTRTI